MTCLDGRHIVKYGLVCSSRYSYTRRMAGLTLDSLIAELQDEARGADIKKSEGKPTEKKGTSPLGWLDILSRSRVPRAGSPPKARWQARSQPAVGVRRIQPHGA